MFDTLVVEGGGSGEVAEVAEAVAEAVAEVVEDVAEAVAEAVEDSSTEEIPASWVERIVRLELAVEAMGLAIAEASGQSSAALAVAENAAEVASDAAQEAAEAVEVAAEPTPTVVEDVTDAEDEPPAGVGRNWLFASGSELRKRFVKRDDD